MPPLRIELTSVQLHLFWGTLIQDSLPTELPRLRQLEQPLKLWATFNPKSSWHFSKQLPRLVPWARVHVGVPSWWRPWTSPAWSWTAPEAGPDLPGRRFLPPIREPEKLLIFGHRILGKRSNCLWVWEGHLFHSLTSLIALKLNSH